MSDPLRDRRPVRDLADRRQVIEISDKIRSFDGLSSVIEADLAALDSSGRPQGWRDSPVSGRIAFGFNDAPARGMTLVGDVEAGLHSVCQRCLRPFAWTLSVPLAFELAEPDDAGTGVTAMELWELADVVISPIEIIDEALVMALPLAARHDEADDACIAVPVAELPRDNDEKLITPFANLRSQMDKDRKD